MRCDHPYVSLLSSTQIFSFSPSLSHDRVYYIQCLLHSLGTSYLECNVPLYFSLLNQFHLTISILSHSSQIFDSGTFNSDVLSTLIPFLYYWLWLYACLQLHTCSHKHTHSYSANCHVTSTLHLPMHTSISRALGTKNTALIYIYRVCIHWC